MSETKTRTQYCPLEEAVKTHGLAVVHVQNFLPSELAQEANQVLFDNTTIAWAPPDKNKVFVYGKWHQVPRQQAAYYFGNRALRYRFSGASFEALPISGSTLILQKIHDELLNKTGVDYNFVFINLYRNGEDNIGFHKDDEDDLAPESPIASLSFGATRDFILKKIGHDSVKVSVPLANNDYVCMNFPTNRDWLHSVPVRKTVKAPRINLTFRVFK